MPSSKVQDKHDEPINEGDYVFTKIRGGSHQGEVDTVVTDERDAEKEDVKNPPKVIYNDQHGHRVAHNPQTLDKMQPDE